MSQTQQRTDMAFVMAPAFLPDAPPLGVPALVAHLRSHDYTASVLDLNMQLHAASEPAERERWSGQVADSKYWQNAEEVARFIDHHRPLIERQLQELLEGQPRVVGFSWHMMNSMCTMAIVEILRELAPRGQLIVAGGPGCYVNTLDDGALRAVVYGYEAIKDPERREALDRWLTTLDAIVLEEGELPLLEICRRAREGRDLAGVPNTLVPLDVGRYAPLVREPPVADLSTLAAPTFVDFDLSLYREPKLPFLFTRGCIKRCTCCTEHNYWHKVRTRPPEAVLEEFRHHVQVHKINGFMACDMLLNANVPALERLCDLIIEDGIKVNWYGNVVVRKEMTRALFDKLARAGVGHLIFGIESGSQRIIDLIQKRYTVEVAEQNLADCHAAGISTYINIIVGFPTETEEDFQQTLEFLRRNHQHIDWVILLAMLEIFHHTAITRDPERFQIDPEVLAQMDECYGSVDWEDRTGNTPEVRRQRLERVQRLLIDLDLPDPASRPGDQPAMQTLGVLINHHAVHAMLEAVLQIDHDLITPIDAMLMALLEHPNPRWRAGAAKLTGMIGRPAILESLHAHLVDDDDQVKYEAGIAVGRIADPRSLDWLAPMLTEDAYAALDPLQRQILRRMRTLYRAWREQAAARQQEQAAARQQEQAAPRQQEAAAPGPEEEAAPRQQEAAASGQEDEAAPRQQEAAASGPEDEAAPRQLEAAASGPEDEAAPRQQEAAASGQEDEAASPG